MRSVPRATAPRCASAPARAHRRTRARRAPVGADRLRRARRASRHRRDGRPRPRRAPPRSRRRGREPPAELEHRDVEIVGVGVVAASSPAIAASTRRSTSRHGRGRARDGSRAACRRARRASRPRRSRAARARRARPRPRRRGRAPGRRAASRAPRVASGARRAARPRRRACRRPRPRGGRATRVLERSVDVEHEADELGVGGDRELGRGPERASLRPDVHTLAIARLGAQRRREQRRGRPDSRFHSAGRRAVAAPAPATRARTVRTCRSRNRARPRCAGWHAPSGPNGAGGARRAGAYGLAAFPARGRSQQLHVAEREVEIAQLRRRRRGRRAVAT